tara:strand:+ start:1355 stop:1678 length:324 start_codon:yes stop_codon:yes gene_type:complete
MEQEKNISLNNKQKTEISNDEKKGPLSLLTGSITSFILFITFYKLSIAISIYFATHKPVNNSEIVQNISASLNTLIVGLSFLATFSFGFIGLGLFIVFVRSFFIKKE